MAGVRIQCRGCHRPITISRVSHGEDDTDPWRATFPPGDTYVSTVDGLIYYRCRTGDGRAIPTPKREADLDPDIVEHETWLEYHDRLVREYYNVEAEWALIKEICPELDRPEPAPRRVRRAKFHPYHGVAAGFAFTASLNFMIGATVVGVIWLMAALTMLMAASRG